MLYRKVYKARVKKNDSLVAMKKIGLEPEKEGVSAACVG